MRQRGVHSNVGEKGEKKTEEAGGDGLENGHLLGCAVV